MRVLIDRVAVEVDIEPARPVGEIIDRVRAYLADRQRIIARIYVAGAPVPPDQLEQMLTRPGEQVGPVEFDSASPRDLAREAVRAVAALLGDAAQLQQDAAAKLSAGATGKAMELLLGCLNMFKTAQEAISQAVQLTRIDLNQLAVEDRQAGELIAELAGQLATTRTALESRDFAMLGDLLSYEFPAATLRWQAILAALDEAMGEG